MKEERVTVQLTSNIVADLRDCSVEEVREQCIKHGFTPENDDSVIPSNIIVKIFLPEDMGIVDSTKAHVEMTPEERKQWVEKRRKDFLKWVEDNPGVKFSPGFNMDLVAK